MKRKYIKLSTEKLEMQPQGVILAGSLNNKQELIEKEFNIYTDPYNDEEFQWDKTYID